MHGARSISHDTIKRTERMWNGKSLYSCCFLWVDSSRHDLHFSDLDKDTLVY